MNKRGIFFTIDAIIAVTIVLFSLILLSNFSVTERDSPAIQHFSRDVVKVFTYAKVGELDNEYVQSLIVAGTIDDANNTIFEQLGEFWATGQTTLAEQFINNVTESLIPERFGYSILVNDEVIYTNNKSIETSLVSSKKIITGIERDKPTQGFTSRSYLSSLSSKRFTSYAYLGGFVGQGNVTTFISDIPTGVTLTGMALELSAGGPFNLFINGNQCQGTFNQTAQKLQADYYNITSCTGSLITGGSNNFTFSFTTGVSNAYIGGGFVRVDYLTNEFQPSEETGILTKWLPGIRGIINLYDSLYIPGTVNSMRAVIHFSALSQNSSGSSFYVTIGNETVVFENNASGERYVYINDTQLVNLLNYTNLETVTIPIRAGFENVSYNLIFEGNADVAVITDVSGSMNWEMDSSSTGTLRECSDSQFNDTSTRRISVAKCLDRTFAKDIINISGNKIGLISFDSSTNAGETVTPTTNTTLINNTVGTSIPLTGYNPGGTTCVCCGINSARDILVSTALGQTVIDSGETWKYNVNYFFSEPPLDGQGDAWYEQDYDDASWPSGSAILGSTNGLTYSPTVTTEIGSNTVSSLLDADLWEHGTDTSGPPNDFTSGILNSTANTYGIGAGDDGWDWASNTYDYASSVAHDGIVSGRLRISSQDNSNDVSGAYGVEFTITKEMIDLFNTSSYGPRAVVSFNYWWDDRGRFESSDHMWIKAQWVSPISGAHYLGDDYDQGMGNADGTDEIFTKDDPDGDISSYVFTQSVGQWIEANGTYYLNLGGKLLRNNNDEDGRWEFDNIRVQFIGDTPGTKYADLWEHGTDDPGPPNDFHSGILNQTANTYGLGAGNDGWDSSSGVFDYGSAVSLVGLENGRLTIDSQDNSNDVSGAYGIEVNVTQEMFELLNQSGSAVVSFEYWWDDQGRFESDDHMWIKAQWISPTSGTHYLGSDLDTGMNPSDSTFEIYTDEDPDGDSGQQLYSQSIGDWIEGPGMYYFTIGAKLLRSATNEDGEWQFDNIQIKFSNISNHYYFRKSFTLASLNNVNKGILNVLSDDSATVYLNGNVIDSESAEHLGEYWNVRGKSIDASNFNVGTNVVAVELVNGNEAAKFDLKLRTVNHSRDKAMMVMTDGVANIQCAEQNTGSSSQDAVQAACDAREDYGITVYAVGYSDSADETTLQAIATCGEGLFEKSDNTSALEDFYADVASSIVSTSRHSQTIEVSAGEDVLQSTLFEDSFIEVNYTSTLDTGDFNEIALRFEITNLTNCTNAVNIPYQVRVTEALVTSYSSEHWSDLLQVNGNVVYNLSTYNPDYTPLGDPFIINIPPSELGSGTNVIELSTGDIPGNSTGCSSNNTFIYTGMVAPSASYSTVLETADGCDWTIEIENAGNISVSIPSDYSGTDSCSYVGGNISYDTQDSTDSAAFQLLANIDFDGNGRVDINIQENDLQIEALYVSQVPSLWGPSVAEIRVWD